MSPTGAEKKPLAFQVKHTVLPWRIVCPQIFTTQSESNYPVYPLWQATHALDQALTWESLPPMRQFFATCLWRAKKEILIPSKTTSTLWLFNIAMENGPFIDGLPIKNGDFPWLC